MLVNALEKKRAKKDGAKVVKNSGRGIAKGDASTDTFLIDYKFTEKISFSINIEKWRKHELDAYKSNKEPVIVVIYEQNKRALAILDWELLKELEDVHNENEDLKEELNYYMWLYNTKEQNESNC